MRTLFDLDTRELKAWNGGQLPAVVWKPGDRFAVRVKFGRGGVFEELPSGATGTLGLKRKDVFTGGFLAAATSWTKTGSGPGAVYTFDVNLATSEVVAAFGTNPPTVPCSLEIEVAWGDQRLSSQVIAVTLQNQVVTGTEGTPVTVPDMHASQAEAEAGTSAVKWMSPLRVRQAVEARSAQRLTSSMTWADIVENGFYIHMGGDRVLTVNLACWLPTFFNAGVGNLILRSAGAGYELAIAPGEARRVVVEWEAGASDWSIGEDAGVRLWRDGGGSYSGSYQLPQQTAAAADSIITRQLLGLESILNSSRMPIIMTAASISSAEATGTFAAPVLFNQGLRFNNGSGSASGDYNGISLGSVAEGPGGSNIVQMTSRFGLEFTYAQGANSAEVVFVATLGSNNRRDLTARGIGMEINGSTGAVVIKAHNGTSQSTQSVLDSGGAFYRRYILVWDGLRTLQLYRANINAATFFRPTLRTTLTLGADVTGALSNGTLRFGFWATGAVPINQDAFVQNAIFYRF